MMSKKFERRLVHYIPGHPEIIVILRECTPEEYLIPLESFPILARENEDDPLELFGCIQVDEILDNNGCKNFISEVYGLPNPAQV